MKLSSVKPETRLFAMFIGRSKSGKTVAANSFPQPLDVDFDDRIRGLIPAVQEGIIKQEVDYIQFRRPQGWADVDEWLEKLQMNIISHSLDLPKTLVCPDSISGFTRLMIADSIRLQSGQIVSARAPKPNEKPKGLRLEGLNDYKYESNATQQLFDALKSMPMHVIATAHIVNKWGKEVFESDAEQKKHLGEPAEIIGEKLLLRDNLGESLLTYFNEVYRFEKRFDSAKQEWRYFVKFDSDMAASSILSNLKGEFDITGKNFYEFWLEKIKERQSK